ncbi:MULTISPECIES: protein-glutamate methylesterase/protein-glutamine glutaminase [Pseudomonas]|uniref:Protein-glutamate methylesterase/protein-glutamine glutaminase n=1 Tax=Pseudomonas congelans TaxID=200452 RepID=A0A0P9M6L2_9PSED|nr:MULTISPECIES: chemotaxis response regulator protein-glutamate methylesterase [Pseudomonas]KFE47367.1 chemotaxis protein CheY [Pseudomonas congelans]KPW87125.1 Chemotaxis response regulator protein-glutamate methylesterase [Pseudomonas congelans]MBC8801495.1 chemotaxis response regulator protein-glutamate methylesterase [Pseudomonas congelans]MBP1145116.1 two-component system chemotaxis response regulator CheB [Pseudomonas sp. PvP027]MCF5166315.1 chemotaxis-specific protein-glutamate methylt
MPNKKISVLLVDDSAVVRQVLVAILNDTPDIHVIGAASDPIFAMGKLAQEWPDVIVLDVEMPRMDGITFLKKIMSERPTPVVICSSLTQKGAETSLQALSAGAVEIITKPTTGLKNFLIDSAAELVAAVRAAANSNVRNLGKRTAAPVLTPASKLTADAILPAAGGHAMAQTTERIVAIGTSTGGTQALEAVLTALPRVCPGMVIVQHMPEKFTASFAERLNSLSQIEVREARNNDRILPGLALIAPGGKHMMVTRSGAYYHVQVIDGPLVNRHRPSVDVLFRSVAKFAGKNATGIIMTGMGDDGARGLKEMLDAGSATVAQDEASCVVFGMPKEAIKLNAAQRIIPLQEIHQVILHR